MKKFRLRQECTITEEDGTPIKEFSADLWISTEGISEESVKNMLGLYANGFTGMLEEMNFSGQQEEIDFMSDDIRKGWQ